MRKRLTPEKRRAEILRQAGQLFAAKGYSAVEMEDIRLACEISRGGLYHHFANKTAIVSAIVEDEVKRLAATVTNSAQSPILAVLGAGSAHLGNDAGVFATLELEHDKLAYLSFLEQATADHLRPVIRAKLAPYVEDGADSGHVTELFLAVNALINRRVMLAEWDDAEGRRFAATALRTLAPLMRDGDALISIAEQIQHGGECT